MKYLDIAKHYANRFKEYGDTHKGMDWPNQKDAEIRFEIMYDIIEQSPYASRLPLVLDFGCGTGHFYEWVCKTYGVSPFVYYGLDINKSCIDVCRKKFPGHLFYDKDILVDNDIPNFDYIICNGTFTEKLTLSSKEMMEFTMKVLTELWSKTNIAIAFNLMSKNVDWERDDLNHVSYDDIISEITKRFTKNFMIADNYGLYEYTVYMYK